MNKRDYHILFKLTTRERPQRAIQCLEHLYGHKSTNRNFSTIISVDEDDAWLTSDLIRQFKRYPNTTVFKGTSKNKVHAINRDIPSIDHWDILVNVSDDQLFLVADFDNIIRDNFDHLDQVLHFPDDNRNDLLTMSIIGADYYQRDRYVYHPSYYGQCCDDEAMHVARQRGCYKYIDQVLHSHAHANYGKSERDHLYIRYDRLFQDDLFNFQKRQAENFGL